MTRGRRRVCVEVTAEVADGVTTSGLFTFQGEPDESDLEACRAIIRAMHEKLGS